MKATRYATVAPLLLRDMRGKKEKRDGKIDQNILMGDFLRFNNARGGVLHGPNGVMLLHYFILWSRSKSLQRKKKYHVYRIFT